MSVKYCPPESVVPFYLSEEFSNFIVGPVGSTKTTSSIMKVAREAQKVAPCKDGIRRSRCAVVRNTRQMLYDTTIPDFLKWYPDGIAGAFMKTDSKFLLKFNDVECEVLFRGLDDANDVRRLLSLQLTFGMMDEFREIHPDIYNALTGRLGRYPDGTMVPHRPEWGVDEKGNPRMGCVDDSGQPVQKVWGATNPPDADTFWEELLTNPPDNMHVTIQPSGLSEQADWIKYLPSGYYDNLAKGKSEDWIDVYIHGKFGRSLAGQPVFRSFVRDFHVAKEPLKPILNGLRPVICSLDFGLNPSATLLQLDSRGRLNVFSALTSDGMGLVRFIDTMLKPHLSAKFPGATVIVVGDPAGTARVQTDESTVYDILKQKGFSAMPARTNSIVARVAAVDAFLNRQIDGGPGMLVDPVDCAPLVKALAGRYRYKKKKDGEMDDTPEKNEASHIADAFQYGCLHADALQGGRMEGTKRREVRRVSAVGWT